MTDRFLLSFAAAFGAVNGVLVGVESGGLYDLPNVVLVVSAVVTIGFSAFVGVFVRNSGAQV